MSADNNCWAVLLAVSENVSAKMSLGAAAEAYASENIAVFPLRRRTKLPATANGFKAATTDPDTIRGWWGENPDYNIGGCPPLGVVVLDVDPRSGGDLELRRLIEQHGPLPPTWVARTGGGGWHYWFDHNGEGEIRKQLGRGLDLKIGSTGYLVLPPSIHPSGERYEWISPDGVAL
jgi:Bifunctional DNA primase/polymerase, N-terminal